MAPEDRTLTDKRRRHLERLIAEAGEDGVIDGTRKPNPFAPPDPPDVPEVEWRNPAYAPTAEEARMRWRERQATIELRSDPKRPVIRSEIIERDKSMCWICGKLVHPKELDLDHVIPLCDGGRHLPENVRVAHRECNRWKGRRTIRPIREDQF